MSQRSNSLPTVHPERASQLFMDFFYGLIPHRGVRARERARTLLRWTPPEQNSFPPQPEGPPIALPEEPIPESSRTSTSFSDNIHGAIDIKRTAAPTFLPAVVAVLTAISVGRKILLHRSKGLRSVQLGHFPQLQGGCQFSIIPYLRSPRTQHQCRLARPGWHGEMETQTFLVRLAGCMGQESLDLTYRGL